MTRLGPITVDRDVEEYLRAEWRKRVQEANERGEKIPSFSSFVNTVLREAVRQMKLQESGVR